MKPMNETEGGCRKNHTLSWTRIDQLTIGKCTCSKCKKKHIQTPATQLKPAIPIDGKENLQNAFIPASFQNHSQCSSRTRKCFDLYDIKCNVIESAFEAAESMANLGAIISLS